MDLLRKTAKWLWSDITKLALLGGWLVTVIAPAFAVSGMAQFAQYAPASWIFAGLLGGVMAALGYALVSWGVARMAHASALAKWKQDVDNVNPLDTEFHKRRIRLQDLVSPATNAIVGKKFTGCEILGPFDFYGPHTRISHCAFADCNIVVVGPEDTIFARSVANCVFESCIIHGCTLYISLEGVADFKKYNPEIPLIGDPDRRPRATVGEKLAAPIPQI